MMKTRAGIYAEGSTSRLKKERQLTVDFIIAMPKKKKARVEGWKDRDLAIKIIRESQKTYKTTIRRVK